MANFTISYKLTSNIEGGYANDSNDKGGETYKGIARKKDPNWSGWPIIDSIKKQGWTSTKSINAQAEKNVVLQSSILKYYKTNYWDILNLDYVKDQRICSELYDTGVNMGTGRAGLFVQRCLNVMNRGEQSYSNLKLDGQIGKNTVNTINSLSSSDSYMLWKLLNCLQGEKYISICEANPSQEIFMRSWASRVFENN